MAFTAPESDLLEPSKGFSAPEDELVNPPKPAASDLTTVKSPASKPDLAQFQNNLVSGVRANASKQASLGQPFASVQPGGEIVQSPPRNDPEANAAEFGKIQKPFIPIPKFTVNKDDSKTMAVGKEAVNLLSGIPEFIESPAGLLTLPLGGVAPKTVATLFGADALKNAGQQIITTHKDWDAYTPAQKAAAITDIGGQIGLAGLLGHGVAKGFKSPVEKPAEAPPQPKEQNASEIPSAASLPQPEIRPPVGEEASLRQQGETAGTQGDETRGQVSGTPPRQPSQPLEPPAPEESSKWKVTVQSPQDAGGGNIVPGFVQIDKVEGKNNIWSKSPNRLAKEGVGVPDFSKLPQGQYSFDDAVKKLSSPPEIQGEPSPPSGVPAKEKLGSASEAGEVETPGSRPATQPPDSTAVQPKEPWQKTKSEWDAENFNARKLAGVFEFDDLGPAGKENAKKEGAKQEIPEEDLWSYAYDNKGNFSDKKIPVANRGLHLTEVVDAVRKGKPVPPEVLKDYPDLAAAKPPVTQAKPVQESIVYEGGPANKTAQSVFSNVKTVHYGNKGEEFQYQRTDRKDSKGRTIFEPAKPAEPVKAGGGVEPQVESVTPLEPQSGSPIEAKSVTTEPGQKFKVGNSPQLHSVIETIPQSAVEKANGEQYYRVKNDKTGAEQIVTGKDLTPVTERPLADKSDQKKKSKALDDELRAAKLDPSSFGNVSQKRAALKRAKAISEFPKSQISRAPGAASEGEPGTYSAIQSLADQIEATGKENSPVNEKISAIERARVKGIELKDSVSAGLANLLAVKKAMWDSYSKLAPYTDMKRIVGKWFYAGQKADAEAREFGKQIIRAVPDKARREAITNWIQADGDKGLLKEREEASKPYLAKGYKLAQNLTPRETQIAVMLREYYDRQLEKGMNEGILKEGLDNYITQVWKKENPITRKLQNELVNSRLQPNFKYARKRIFDSYFEGEQAGYKPMKDAGALVAHYDQSFNKSLAARAFIKDLHEGTATDGRPLVEVSGSGKIVDPNEPKPSFLIRPKSVPEEIGDYKTIDHPALRGWKWIGKTPEGNNVLLNGELKVHPEIYDKLKNRLSTSWFRQNPVARGVLNVQGTLKQSLMSISGFHQVQENLHALGHKINPLNLEKLDFSEPVTKSLVEHGLQLADHDALAQFGEGLAAGKLLGKIPGIGPKMAAYNDWLFQENIPRLKLTMAKAALERNKVRYADAIQSGKISPDQVLELTASQANHAFGELPYKYWGRNPNFQDFYRTFLLAPDFLEARAGFVGQAVKPGGLGVKGLLKNEQVQALALLALTQYITARIVNQVIDRDPHWELKNAFRIIYGNRAYSLRTIPGDIIHLISDPRGFTYNRLSPLIGRGGIELATGRDYRGVKRDFFEQMGDLLKSGVPISFNHKNGQNVLETFANAFGVQNQRYDAVQNIQQKAADWKAKNGIKESYETLYNPDADQFAPLRTAIQDGDQKRSQAEFNKLKESIPPAKIYLHFRNSLIRPITGSSANDRKFYDSLNEQGKMEFNESRELQRARLNSVMSLK